MRPDRRNPAPQPAGMGARRYGEALAVLRPLTRGERVHANVLFLLGVAAIEVARLPDAAPAARDALLDEAIASLRVMLIDRPDLVRVRLELARAFIAPTLRDYTPTCGTRAASCRASAPGRRRSGSGSRPGTTRMTSRPVPARVTVRAETVSGTAKAGVDFRPFAGEVAFAPGDRVSRIHVPVLDDAIYEEPETLTVVLSGPEPAGVSLARAVATGTIMNEDLMLAAWLARFGCTVVGQAVDAVTARMAAIARAFDGTGGGAGDRENMNGASGGGIRWTDPGLGLSLDLGGRTLLAHGTADLEDRGFSGGVTFDPDPASGRGPSFSLRHDRGGRAQGGLDALFADAPLDMENRTGPDGGDPAGR